MTITINHGALRVNGESLLGTAPVNEENKKKAVDLIGKIRQFSNLAKQQKNIDPELLKTVDKLNQISTNLHSKYLGLSKWMVGGAMIGLPAAATLLHVNGYISKGVDFAAKAPIVGNIVRTIANFTAPYFTSGIEAVKTTFEDYAPSIVTGIINNFSYETLSPLAAPIGLGIATYFAANWYFSEKPEAKNE